MAESYFPVPLKRIVIDSIPNFDLYIKQKDRYVLYRHANIRFDGNVLQTLIDNNIDSLFVSKGEIKLYEDYRHQMRATLEEQARKLGFEGVFVDPEEIERYHEIIDQYHVVELGVFEPGMVLPFPLYCHENNHVYQCEEFEGKPGPWTLSEKFFQQERVLMIRREDLPQFREMIQKLLSTLQQKAWVDDDARIRQEALVLREMSKMVVRDVLDDPRSGENIKKLDETVDGLVDFILDNDTSFYSLMRISAHDFYTYVHSINVCTLSVGLGATLGLPRKPDLELLGLGTMLHDVGKSMVDPLLINKPGKLTAEEFLQMKNHVTLGEQLLREHHQLPELVLEPVIQHHEKLTGTGYPRGLSGRQIGPFGRIASIVDIYDALTTERSYKRALTPFEALSFLNKTSADYDRECLTKFIVQLGRQIKEENRTA